MCTNIGASNDGAGVRRSRQQGYVATDHLVKGAQHGCLADGAAVAAGRQPRSHTFHMEGVKTWQEHHVLIVVVHADGAIQVFGGCAVGGWRKGFHGPLH